LNTQHLRRRGKPFGEGGLKTGEPVIKKRQTAGEDLAGSDNSVNAKLEAIDEGNQTIEGGSENGSAPQI